MVFDKKTFTALQSDKARVLYAFKSDKALTRRAIKAGKPVAEAKGLTKVGKAKFIATHRISMKRTKRKAKRAARKPPAPAPVVHAPAVKRRVAPQQLIAPIPIPVIARVPTSKRQKDANKRRAGLLVGRAVGRKIRSSQAVSGVQREKEFNTLIDRIAKKSKVDLSQMPTIDDSVFAATVKRKK